VAIVRCHLRSLVQRQGIRIDGSLGSAAHKLRLHDFVKSYIHNAMNSMAICLIPFLLTRIAFNDH
jgi:hypothetical protein